MSLTSLSGASASALAFRELTGLDPASSGDPFVRVRYRYGMLLGADDFTVEQRAHLLRHRLHQALLHGAGVVWGLRVHGDIDMPGELIVEPGFALDPLGRELFVGKAHCLDLAGLASHSLWRDLPREGRKRRAWVVLRYEPCESEPVPALRRPCGGSPSASDALATSRVQDSFRLELAAEPAATPGEVLARLLGREELSVEVPFTSLRDALLEMSLGPAEELARAWDPNEPVALTLAELLLEDVDGKVQLDFDPDTEEPILDNSVRALLPPLAWVAALTLGQPLTGPTEPVGLRVLGVTQVGTDSGWALHVLLSDTVLGATVTDRSVRLLALSETGWSEVSCTRTLSEDGTGLLLTPSAPIVSPSPVQLLLAGASEAPLMSAQGPLRGFVDEPLPPAGRGRDVSWVSTWREET